MADAVSPAVPLAVGLSGATLVTMFPDLDKGALVGAFGGALMFVVKAKDVGAFTRFLYLIIGWIGGYYMAAEVVAQKWAITSAIAAFGCGLVTVVASISIIDAFQTGQPPKWLSFIPGLIGRVFGKRDGP